MQTPHIQSDSTIQRRSAVYRLLATLWLHEVDSEMQQELGSAGVRECLDACGVIVPDAGLDDLAADYCQLFVGPKDHLPPIQSIWQRGQLESETASSMRDFIRLDREMREERISIPDHLGVQLRLQGRFLLSQQGASGDALRECQVIAAHLFESHLRWPSALFAAAIDKAETGFYRGVVKLTRDFLQDEREQFIAFSQPEIQV